MSTITYDWAPFAIEAKAELVIKRLIEVKTSISREEEFRSALNTYLAEYRRNRDAIADKAAHQLVEKQIPMGRRTAEMLRFQAWF
ncbi:MAG: hypothetical protein ABI705_05955 [Aestuariivirga sp.]